jgi:hypothetical protein
MPGRLAPDATGSVRRKSMLDVAYLALGLGSFALLGLYALAVSRL